MTVIATSATAAATESEAGIASAPLAVVGDEPDTAAPAALSAPARSLAAPADTAAPAAGLGDDSSPTPLGRAAGQAPAASNKRRRQTPDAQTRAAALSLLNQLAAWHPALFGAHFQPLQRGVYEALLQSHPHGAIDPDLLRVALQLHTRSTRYLQAMAMGGQRRDLQGQPVEPLAPEHMFMALVELWRRRATRTPEAEQPALRAHWRERIVRAITASGLPRADYAARVATRNPDVHALLDEALAAHAEVAARDEAVLRTFESSGATLEDFAESYGIEARQAKAMLEHARRARGHRSAPADAAMATPSVGADTTK